MAETYFRVTNTVALLAWILLLVQPGQRWVSRRLCATVMPGLLAVTYATVIGWKLATGGPPPGDLTTLAGLRGAFADDWVLAAAWTHYLVFDMVVGAWVARDAVRCGVPWPLRSVALVLTFLAGPVGFLLHLVIRQRHGAGLDADGPQVN
ncbi:MAG: ABA4-like family protein [Planctomycetota bacterium]